MGLTFSEEAKRGIRLQLELQVALDNNAINYFKERLSVYTDFKNKGMYGLSLTINALQNRIAKIIRERDQRMQLIASYQEQGLL